MITVKCILLALLAGATFASECNINVGTVLFAPSDANRECWSADNLALLTSRMVLEGILPDKNCLNINDENILNDIIEYFRLILEVVRKNTFGKTKHIMLMALTDTLGGYMKHFFLPVAKYAYYAGNVDYNSVIRVHQLFDELKNYLRTNGAGWSKAPKDVGKNVVAQPITMLMTPPKGDPCKGLVIQQRASRNRKRSPQDEIIDIPMPYFDSKARPSAIAIPFKAYSLRNMEAKSSAYVLVKFYIAASKCLASKAGNERSIQQFNTNLFSFILQKVAPHFCDEKFYSAFGGALRIVETMKKSGYVKNGKVIGSFNIMPEIEDKDTLKEKMDQGEDDDRDLSLSRGGAGDKAHGQHKQQDAKARRKKTNLILLAALATIILWFFLGACFVCCRIRSSRIKKDDFADEKLKLLEGGDMKSSSSRSTKTKCLSSASSKSKCSSKSGKTHVCDRQTCANFTSSSTSVNDYQKSESSTKDEGTPKSASTKSSTSEKNSGSSTPKTPVSPIQVQTSQYYPASFACHSSITGKFKPGSTTDEFSSKDTIKKPFVFGYDFQTTSEESSPRETSDGEPEMGGNMSK